MTQDIVCNKGKCIDQNSSDYLDECIDCTIAENIERDLLKKEIGKAF